MEDMQRFTNELPEFIEAEGIKQKNQKDEQAEGPNIKTKVFPFSCYIQYILLTQ